VGTTTISFGVTSTGAEAPVDCQFGKKGIFTRTGTPTLETLKLTDRRSFEHH